MKKQCLYCKKIFEKKENESKKYWNKRLYCSRNCHYEIGRTKIKCVICQKEFVVKVAMKDLLKTCSKKCCSENLRNNAIERQKINIRFSPPKANSEKSKKIGKSLKIALKDGRLEHLKKTWEEGSKRWTGKGNPRYKDGNSNGYKMIKTENGWLPEHRVIMEKKIGRLLKPTEIVHHIDGNKLNNNLDNLVVMTIAKHISLHQKGVKEKL